MSYPLSFRCAEPWTHGIFPDSEDFPLVGNEAAFHYWHIWFHQWSVANHLLVSNRYLLLVSRSGRENAYCRASQPAIWPSGSRTTSAPVK